MSKKKTAKGEAPPEIKKQSPDFTKPFARKQDDLDKKYGPPGEQPGKRSKQKNKKQRHKAVTIELPHQPSPGPQNGSILNKSPDQKTPSSYDPLYDKLFTKNTTSTTTTSGGRPSNSPGSRKKTAPRGGSNRSNLVVSFESDDATEFPPLGQSGSPVKQKNTRERGKEKLEQHPHTENSGEEHSQEKPTDTFESQQIPNREVIEAKHEQKAEVSHTQEKPTIADQSKPEATEKHVAPKEQITLNDNWCHYYFVLATAKFKVDLKDDNQE